MFSLIHFTIAHNTTWTISLKCLITTVIFMWNFILGSKCKPLSLKEVYIFTSKPRSSEECFVVIRFWSQVSNLPHIWTEMGFKCEGGSRWHSAMIAFSIDVCFSSGLAIVSKEWIHHHGRGYLYLLAGAVWKNLECSPECFISNYVTSIRIINFNHFCCGKNTLLPLFRNISYL